MLSETLLVPSLLASIIVSESEDNPRRILDTNGFFTFQNDRQVLTFKLENGYPMVDDKDGNMSIPVLLPMRPFHPFVTIQRACAAIENGASGAWNGTHFLSHRPPSVMFPPRQVNTAMPGRNATRLTLRHCYVFDYGGRLKTMLVLAHGSFLATSNNGVQARWAFIFKLGIDGVVGRALEHKGPDGEVRLRTPHRAALRAVIAALEFRAWECDGWEHIVIATDSIDVVSGATSHMRAWATNKRYSVHGGAPVKNRDLWQRLSDLMGKFAWGGCEVSFWLIAGTRNAEAMRAARFAGRHGTVVEEYAPLEGVLSGRRLECSEGPED